MRTVLNKAKLIIIFNFQVKILNIKENQIIKNEF